MKLTKVIIPAAGLGTRLYPWSRSVPKELLPLGSQPGIAYVVQEAVASGCRNVIIIAGARKTEIMDYFEKADVSAHFMYIPQPKPLGLGHAVFMAAPAVGDEYVGIILPDELLINEKKPGLAQLAEIAQREQASVIAVKQVPRECVSAYGVISIKKQLAPGLMEIGALVEKPKVEDAPSNFAIIGRYVLASEIFESLACTQPGAKGEIQLTDAIADMLARGHRVLAYQLEGTRYDIGTTLGWIKAVIAMSLQDPLYREELAQFVAAQLANNAALRGSEPVFGAAWVAKDHGDQASF